MADTLFIRFSHVEGDDDYSLELASSAVGEQRGKMAIPYHPKTWEAIMLALEPGFDPEEAPSDVTDALQPLGDLARLHQTVGTALARTLLADEAMRLSFRK